MQLLYVVIPQLGHILSDKAPQICFDVNKCRCASCAECLASHNTLYLPRMHPPSFYNWGKKISDVTLIIKKY